MLAYALAHWLGQQADSSLVWTPEGSGGSIYVDWHPDTPNKSVAIMTQPGQSTLSKLPGRRPGLQLIVRGEPQKSRATLEWATSIGARLDCISHVDMGETGHEIHVVGITLLQDAPVPIGRDDKGRPEYTLNLACHTHNPTTHRPGAPA